MIVAIDGVRLSKKPTGVTDITISIINTFTTLYPEVRFYIITNAPLRDEVNTQLNSSKSITVVIKPLIFFKTNGLLWTSFKLNKIVSAIKPDYFIEPNFVLNPLFFPKKTKLITYIHDLVFKEYPDTMKLVTRFNMNLFFLATLRRTDILWTNSSYTSQRLSFYYKKEIRSKILFEGSGINPFFLKRAREKVVTEWDDSRIKQYENKKYLLFVGTIEPRKNIPFLLKFFESLAHTNYYLIIVGSNGWGATMAEVNQILENIDYPSNRVIHIPYASSKDLVKLYKNAFTFISTSTNEGLGLPQLEAMACGCPVLSPHNSAMIEVVDGGGITVKSWEIIDWQSALNEISRNRNYYITLGYKKLEKYNWNKITSRLYTDHMAATVK